MIYEYVVKTLQCMRILDVNQSEHENQGFSLLFFFLKKCFWIFAHKTDLKKVYRVD